MKIVAWHSFAHRDDEVEPKYATKLHGKYLLSVAEQYRLGIDSRHGTLGLDKLAGDDAFVFFSLGSVYANSLSFGFDALALIKKGAGVRRRDLYDGYVDIAESHGFTESDLDFDYEDMLLFREDLDNASFISDLRRYYLDNTYFGAQAEREMNRGARELLFPRRVPLSWSIARLEPRRATK